MDNYHPDLLYSDGGVPFGNEVGLSMIAHLYNSSAAAHRRQGRGGLQLQAEVRRPLGARTWNAASWPGSIPIPWQTDTSIGDWFYNRNWKFRPVSWVIHMLVDNVSKNGNLLLNVVQRPDGSLDPEVEEMLAQLADWNAIHGEAIYGTRPWLVYGEGAREGERRQLQRELQVQRPRNPLHHQGPDALRHRAGLAGGPQLVIHSLAQAGRREDQQHHGHQPAGLRRQARVEADGRRPDRDPAGKEGLGVHRRAENHRHGLSNVPCTPAAKVIAPDNRGRIVLQPDDAEMHGNKIATEEKAGRPNIGFWDNAGDWASWKVHFDKPGRFQVRTACAAMGDGEFDVVIAGRRLSGKAPATGTYDKFADVDLGSMEIPAAGDITVELRAHTSGNWRAINFRALPLDARWAGEEVNQWHSTRTHLRSPVTATSTGPSKPLGKYATT